MSLPVSFPVKQWFLVYLFNSCVNCVYSEDDLIFCYGEDNYRFTVSDTSDNIAPCNNNRCSTINM